MTKEIKNTNDFVSVLDSYLAGKVTDDQMINYVELYPAAFHSMVELMEIDIKMYLVKIKAISLLFARVISKTKEGDIK